MVDNEQDFSVKIAKCTEKSTKKVKEITDYFGSMEKLKTESLRKTEEMMASAVKDLDKIEQDTLKSKDLSPETKQRINREIEAATNTIRQKYDELKKRISSAIIPF